VDIAVIVSTWLPGARNVKAFNTIFASVQGNPGSLGVEVDGLFATDDSAARATVGGLLKSLGFRPVNVGPLASARELEAMALLNIRLQMTAGGDWRTAFTLVGVPKAALDF
jgi:predicted dinucleotide-binding enzyme